MNFVDKILEICKRSDIEPFMEESNNFHVINYIMNGSRSEVLTDSDYGFLDGFFYEEVSSRMHNNMLDLKHVQYLATSKESGDMFLMNLLLDTYNIPLFLSTYDNNDELYKDIYQVEKQKKKVIVYEKA